MLLEGCAVAFASPVGTPLLLLSRAGDPLPDILRCWGPTGSLPHAAGQVPDTATTMPPSGTGQGQLPTVPGSEQVAAPGARHPGKRLKENRGAISSFFFLTTTDRRLAEAAIWCTFSPSCYCPRGGQYFPVHGVMPAAETQRARRNGAVVKAPGKGWAQNQDKKDFHSFQRADSQTTAGSKTFHCQHEGSHWKCLAGWCRLEPGGTRGFAGEWHLWGVGRNPWAQPSRSYGTCPGAGRGGWPACRPGILQAVSPYLLQLWNGDQKASSPPTRAHWGWGRCHASRAQMPRWWGYGRGSSNTWMKQKVPAHGLDWLSQDMPLGCKTSSRYLLGTTWFFKKLSST